jgi:hypothetical protein
LLLHPWSEQAVSRACREDPVNGTLEKYQRSTLYTDVVTSCETVVNWIEGGANVEGRLYKVMPACFALFVNDTVFVEHYHFGTGGRASGKVPLFEVEKGGKYYQQLAGHFDFVWKTAEPYRLSRELVESLRKPGPKEQEDFQQCIRFLRPDLCTAATSLCTQQA